MSTRADRQYLSHSVYFTLNDPSAEAVEKLLADCQTYLTGHPGAIFYSAGTLVEELDRPVNDRQFDVALHVVFENKAAHDQYQQSPRHQEFLQRNHADWKQVRVFDAYVTSKP